MEKKLFPSDCIKLDGRMDEPVWNEVEEYTGFKEVKIDGQLLTEEQTFFKIIPCEDCIYVGVYCAMNDMKAAMERKCDAWAAEGVELFFSATGNPYDFYQFYVSPKNIKITKYYEEGGNITPDPYEPEWNYATHIGEDYWTAEVELPLTAFYMTAQERWSTEWLVNVARRHRDARNGIYLSSWSYLEDGFLFPTKFNSLDGFPIRSPKNELHISQVTAEIIQEKEDGYYGLLHVQVKVAYGGEYEFNSDYADTATVMLNKGLNTFTVPCHFENLTRYKVMVSLTRAEDNVEFKRYYPVTVSYEPIVLSFTKPEYRANFYPGQDCTSIEGKVKAALPVTLKLEGPGIETQVITPNEDGSFVFATPNFEKGDAFLTATTAENEVVIKIRNLPPSDHMMTWISEGKLIVNGKPVLRRNLYGDHWFGGEAFQRRYDADDLHQTLDICQQDGTLEAARVIPGSESMGGEATLDARPSDQMMEHVRKVVEANRNRDFAYYYICDEPECRYVSPIYLKYIYDYITDVDPYHAVMMASRAADVYVDAADWFETHPYINPSTDKNGNRVYIRPINSVGKFVDDIANLNRSDKCIGFLPTCFGALRERKNPYPTFEEYICHTWAAMVHGVKTLWPYAYHDINDRASIYEGARYVFSSLEALEDLILHAKRTVLLRNEIFEAALYELGDEKMFVLVNTTNESQKVTLDGISGTWYNFRRGNQITGNTFELKPLEVVIGTSKVRDAGLPTFEEALALVEKLENKRKSSPSLLFERRWDMEIIPSAGVYAFGWVDKLFDGVEDNLGITLTNGEGSFLELKFTDVHPTFNKVVVRGRYVADMEIKVRNNGELSVPEIADMRTEEFATTFLLKDAICPEALRLEFKSKFVELYEIEVY